MRKIVGLACGSVVTVALLTIAGCERDVDLPAERVKKVETEVERKGDKVEIERKVETTDGKKYEEEVEVPR
jgi:hypothetical protein